MKIFILLFSALLFARGTYETKVDTLYEGIIRATENVKNLENVRTTSKFKKEVIKELKEIYDIQKEQIKILKEHEDYINQDYGNLKRMTTTEAKIHRKEILDLLEWIVQALIVLGGGGAFVRWKIKNKSN